MTNPFFVLGALHQLASTDEYLKQITFPVWEVIPECGEMLARLSPFRPRLRMIYLPANSYDLMELAGKLLLQQNCQQIPRGIRFKEHYLGQVYTYYTATGPRSPVILTFDVSPSFRLAEKFEISKGKNCRHRIYSFPVVEKVFFTCRCRK